MSDTVNINSSASCSSDTDTTDRLGEVYPPAKEYADVASGLLAVSVSREPRDFVLWFRPQVVETVTWGGDPRKPVEPGANGDRLTPRKSFEAWTETVRGRSSPWAPSENDAAFDLRVSLLEVVLRRIDAAARERLRALERERLLMAELDHRVKNTLANVQALVSHTSRSATSLRDFAEGLDRRIRSMSRAQSLLTESRWEGVSIDALVHEELAAYKTHDNNIRIVGPSVILEPKSALALSLAIHELATNAAKYGALSVESGRLDIGWKIGASGELELAWQESGGPRVLVPERRGFGSTLIERVLAMEIGGRSKLSFEPGGVQCSIRLPRSTISSVGPAEAVEPAFETAPAVPRDLEAARQRILVVEDSALVSMVIEDVIADMGWTVVGPATRLEQAVELARTEPFEAALLDVNLAGQMSWEVAAILQDRRIPFSFTTGYDGGTILPARFVTVPIVGKPFTAHQIETALRALVDEAAHP